MYDLSLLQIIVRLASSLIIAGIIGYDREHKNRPAGIKTHILVCLGACVIALIQKEIAYNSLNIALSQPNLTSVVRSDEARLIAQIVSGVGFLGAGTIMVQHRTILGLTTAASLWAVAGLGIAIGMGEYKIALCSAFIIILVLMFLKKIIHVNSFKRIEIQYQHKKETKEFILNYFNNKDIIISDVSFKMTQNNDNAIYTNIYEIEIPKRMTFSDIIEDISMNKNIMRIQLVSL